MQTTNQALSPRERLHALYHLELQRALCDSAELPNQIWIQAPHVWPFDAASPASRQREQARLYPFARLSVDTDLSELGALAEQDFYELMLASVDANQSPEELAEEALLQKSCAGDYTLAYLDKLFDLMNFAISELRGSLDTKSKSLGYVYSQSTKGAMIFDKVEYHRAELQSCLRQMRLDR